ncbi:Cthe_2314 family HEPN domain-containing protein [Cohnella yongneupensis]|uniref:Cthe_2314 family HEPN domain-containing protein n=1 Tax=Cohnella yongneupensis TaxID=425006 RepID=A0ABW0QUT1_9BACL
MLFGEQPREWTGTSLDTVRAIEKFIRLAFAASDRSRDAKLKYVYQSYGVWAEGLLRSMDELEQSRYAAKQYASLVRHARVDEFTPEEKLNYYRHVYYDKNAYIRVFALLDKLGTLLNELLELKTERMKAHFSFFTVLRNMRLNRLHAELMTPLNELKEQHKESFNRLRSRRNTEIHHMNAELQDDLRTMLPHQGEWRQLEDLKANMADLDRAWDTIEATLGHSFRYACKQIGQTH